MNVELWMWLAVCGGIIVMLLVDLVAHRKAHEISLREAALWSGFWVATGVAFGILIWISFGAEFGEQYFSGFVIEKSLAIDNVFIWALIFAAFSVPRKYQHRVLFLGVLGALVFRGIFIALGAVILENFAWVLYVFALFLIYTGVRLLIKRHDHSDPTQGRFYKWLSRVVPTAKKYYGQRLFVRVGGAVLATPLFLVLVLVEFTDIIFAVDSIPAIFAVTAEPFLVFTANAFALLGLRAMYFLLADLMHRFVYLKIALALVLVWVGIKMGLHDFVKVPSSLSLILILTILITAIIASLIVSRNKKVTHASTTSKSEFPEASQAEMDSLSPLWRFSSRA